MIMEKINNTFFIIFVSQFSKYIFFCVLFFLILKIWVYTKNFRYFLHRNYHFFSMQTMRDIFLSTLTCATYALLYSLLSLLSFSYSIPVDTASPLKMAIWTIIVLIYFDFFFYWSHRLLHSSFLKRFHRLHHASVQTTPLTALSFHPLDVVIQNIGIIFLLMVVNFTENAWFIFTIPAVLLNSYGHSGIDFGASDWEKNKILKIFNKPQHHAIHHLDGRYNFGLYFTLWDRICGTFKNIPYAQAADERLQVPNQNQKE